MGDKNYKDISFDYDMGGYVLSEMMRACGEVHYRFGSMKIPAYLLGAGAAAPVVLATLPSGPAAAVLGGSTFVVASSLSRWIYSALICPVVIPFQAIKAAVDYMVEPETDVTLCEVKQNKKNTWSELAKTLAQKEVKSVKVGEDLLTTIGNTDAWNDLSNKIREVSIKKPEVKTPNAQAYQKAQEHRVEIQRRSTLKSYMKVMRHGANFNSVANRKRSLVDFFVDKSEEGGYRNTASNQLFEMAKALFKDYNNKSWFHWGRSHQFESTLMIKGLKTLGAREFRGDKKLAADELIKLVDKFKGPFEAGPEKSKGSFYRRLMTVRALAERVKEDAVPVSAVRRL
jgi:hypothetical protein